ncbi:MAG: pilin, partial [Xanthomonadales bacterium]|nr:pilin [Xanthomonadales bacterium]
FQWQTGSLPFDADTPLAVLYKQIQEPLPEARLRDLPVDMARVLRKALDKDPRMRPATAVALVDQLAAALGGAAARSASAPPPTARVEPAARFPNPPVPPTRPVEPAARFPDPPAAPRPVPTARAEPAEARDPISNATPPPATSTPASPAARSMGWLFFFAIIAILAVIALPAYKNYVARSQVAAGLADIRGGVVAFEEIIQFGSKTGLSALSDVGLPAATPNCSTIEVTGNYGDTSGQNIACTLLGDQQVRGKIVNLTRDVEGRWVCSLAGVADPDFAPVGCELAP